MIRWNIYTPEGMQDILFEECAIKREIENRIIGLYQKKGFLEVQPPIIEFYDVFAGQAGTIKQEEMYKFFDERGRILVLRPDITTSVARIAATKFRQLPAPWRFFYVGNVFRMEGAGDGKLYQNEFTQAGVEIIGTSQPESDAEIISCIINSIKSTGLKEFQIELGQTEFFKGLMEEAEFSEEESNQIRDIIESKDYIGLENELNRKKIPEKLNKLILEIPAMFGSIDLIASVLKRVKNNKSKLALENLLDIYDILKDYKVEKYINIDLGMVQSINYYTGMVFKGLTHGVGSTICGGGRYDNLTGEFGDAMPATGGAIGVNRLMLALNRQNIKSELPETDILIRYTAAQRKSAIHIAEALRKKNMIVEINFTSGTVEESKEYAKTRNVKKLINVFDTDMVEIIDLASGKSETATVEDLLG